MIFTSRLWHTSNFPEIPIRIETTTKRRGAKALPPRFRGNR